MYRCKSNNRAHRAKWNPDAQAEYDIKFSQQWIKHKFNMKKVVSVSTILRLALVFLVRALKFQSNDSLRCEVGHVQQNRQPFSTKLPSFLEPEVKPEEAEESEPSGDF